MCASAILWSSFRECIFGTSIAHLIKKGWSQIKLPAEEVFSKAGLLGNKTRLIGGVLANETDGYFEWQYDGGAVCPSGCERMGSGGCEPVVNGTWSKSEL